MLGSQRRPRFAWLPVVHSGAASAQLLRSRSVVPTVSGRAGCHRSNDCQHGSDGGDHRPDFITLAGVADGGHPHQERRQHR
jgi:hypothetical protein